MSVKAVVAARKSVRGFLPNPVDETLLRDLISQAARAPSGGNLQPWFVHVVSGQSLIDLKQKIKTVSETNMMGEGVEYPIYPEELPQIYKDRQRKVAMEMYDCVGIARDDHMGRLVQMSKNFDFFGAPVGIFFSIDRMMGKNQWAHLGMYMQTLALLAQEEGLATCMQEAWATFYKTVSSFLSLPPEKMLYCGMALGYEDKANPINNLATERAPVAKYASFFW